MSFRQVEATLDDVLQRTVQWDALLSARLISDRELQLIRRFDKATETIQSSLLEEAGPSYIEAFLTVLRNVTREDVVQYVLAVLVDLVSEDPSKSALFHQQSEMHLANLPDPYSIFLRLLSRQDWFTQECACKMLTVVLDSRPDKSLSLGEGSQAFKVASASSDNVEATIIAFVDWLCSQLSRPSNTAKSVPTAVSALASLLKERAVRVIFVKANGVALLTSLLRAPTLNPEGIQLLYEACLCVWQLSYLDEGVAAIASTGIVAGLVDVAKSAAKEKVFRVAILALKNLMESENAELTGEMVEGGLQKIVAIRSLDSWADEDVASTLVWLEEALRKNVEIASSFEKYKKEVLSGSLDWSPMHTSDSFWRENVERFGEKDYQVLRVLLKLLEASRETRTLTIGCHDLGKFITHHPDGRFVVTDLRGKEMVMRLMMHNDANVQKQALLCVQKLMLAKDKADYLIAAQG